MTVLLAGSCGGGCILGLRCWYGRPGGPSDRGFEKSDPDLVPDFPVGFHLLFLSSSCELSFRVGSNAEAKTVKNEMKPCCESLWGVDLKLPFSTDEALLS